MLKTLSRVDFFSRLQIFLMLFLSAGFICSNGIISMGGQLVLWALLAFSLLLKNKGRWASNEMVISILLALLIVMSDLFNGERFTLTVLMVAMILVSYLFVYKFSFSSFSIAYVDVMIVLSVISLVLYAACILTPSLQSLNLITGTNNTMANFYIYVHNPFSIRNYGMFWEPGAFQAFLSVAFLFEYYSNNPRPIRFIILLIASITTFSTTGYISIGLIALLVILTPNKRTKKIRAIVLLLIPILIVVAITNVQLLTGDAGSVFGKLEGLSSGGNNMSSTTAVRFFSIVKPLEEFINSPILGCGYENLQKKTESFTENMNTCTFINYFAVYGVFFGLIMIVGYAKFCNKLGKTFFISSYLFFLFFVITISENMQRIPLFIIIPLYGYLMISSSSKKNRIYD